LSKLGLASQEKATILALYAAIIVVTIAGFGTVALIGRQYVVLAGMGIVAYVFGLRHGVDADHIAAIDNTTRKLMQEGKRPLTVGTWFSLGHSTVVVGLIVALTVATRAVAASIPALQSAGSIIGTLISGTFLFLIGLINVVIVLEIYRIFRGLSDGKLNESQLEEALNKRGFMNRYFGRLFKIVQAPWQIYPIGVLFGFGFDTASEVALIAMSVGVGASSSVPIWMILVLPFMFTCGMLLVDTSDGVSMRLAYGWAFLKPIRKTYYNLTVTIISVLVAFLIGGIELTQVVSGELKLTGGFWDWLSGLDFETLGFGIVGIFIISWLVSIAFYRYKGYENTAFQSIQQQQ
jgi:nickel/cobalt transporter (NiCoT) family protein